MSPLFLHLSFFVDCLLFCSSRVVLEIVGARITEHQADNA